VCAYAMGGVLGAGPVVDPSCVERCQFPLSVNVIISDHFFLILYLVLSMESAGNLGASTDQINLGALTF
jgi:hypothetical protein